MANESLRSRLQALRGEVLARPLRMILLIAIATSGVVIGDLVNLPNSDVLVPVVAIFPASLLVDRWMRNPRPKVGP